MCSALILWTTQPLLLPTISKQLVTVEVYNVLPTLWHGSSASKQAGERHCLPILGLTPFLWGSSHFINTLIRLLLPSDTVTSFPLRGVPQNHLEGLLKHMFLDQSPRVWLSRCGLGSEKAFLTRSQIMPPVHRLHTECVWHVVPGLSVNKAGGAMIARRRQSSENTSSTSSLMMYFWMCEPQ